MSLTEAFLTESGGMRGLEAGSNRVTEAYNVAVPTSVSDNFNQADGVRAGWTTLTGSGFTVFSNTYAPVAANNFTSSQFDTGVGSPDMWAEATLVGPKATDGWSANLVVRHSYGGSGNTGYAFAAVKDFYGTGLVLQIRKFVNGGEQEITQGSYPALLTGDHVCAIQAIGSALEIFIDGVSVMTGTNSEITTGDKAGFIAYNNNANEARWDNFRAGVGAYPGLPAPEAGVVTWFDNFDRPDGDLESAEWDTYAIWGTYPCIQISNGATTNTPSYQPSFAVRKNVAPSDDQYIKFTIDEGAKPIVFGLYQEDITDSRLGLTVEWQDYNQVYWWDGGNFRGNPVVEGKPGPHEVELRCVGGVADLLIDGVIVSSISPVTPRPAGSQGFGYGNADPPCRLDNMEGGATDRVYLETFTGTNGAAWPGSFNYISIPANCTLQGGKGQLVTGANPFNEVSFWPNKGPADFLLTFDMAITARPGGGYFGIQFRKNFEGNFPGNSIELEMGGGFLALSGGGVSQNVTPPTINVGDIIHWKLRAAGPVIQVKVWLNATPEPSTWLIDSTGTTSLLPQGEIQFIAKTGSGGGAATYTFDNIKIYDSPDPRDLLFSTPSALPNIDWWVDINDESTLAKSGNIVTAIASKAGTKTFTAASIENVLTVANGDPVTPDFGPQPFNMVELLGYSRLYEWTGTATAAGPAMTVFAMHWHNQSGPGRFLSMKGPGGPDWQVRDGMALNTEGGYWPSGYRGGVKLSTLAANHQNEWTAWVRVFTGTSDTLHLMDSTGAITSSTPVSSTPGNFNVTAIGIGGAPGNVDTTWSAFNTIGAVNRALGSPEVLDLLNWMGKRAGWV